MPKEIDTNTEQKILDSATKVFHEKGYDGTRMQEIADDANINKGLLHYYFKSKDSLFETIFSLALGKLISKIQVILELEIPLEMKIDLMVEEYMNMLSKNSYLPRFVLNELNKNPEKFIAKHIGNNMKNTFSGFALSVKKEVDAGLIRQVDARQLFMNIISMIIFPFIGRPMIQVVIGIDNKEFQELIKERKDHIKSFVKQAIKK
ncbi:MAG: TetR family transcriptional regulator [Bacteroidota bacterium]|nr:TetR family transcriptional regulator [Bacteroidota bacterium]MDP3146115.1 TetR family transcriptional regulator [Bacteroidota bacterium]MDP3556727.1 TetR family transcriptional regulator [Bacteroidota bacterium]